MKVTMRYGWGFLFILLIVGIIVLLIIQHESTIPRDYELPHDNFDKTTMEKIQADLQQYQVALTPHDHEVYMVTGGLGVANPRIMEWGSNGNMAFGLNDSPGTIFQIQEISQNPMTWKKVIPNGKPTPQNAKTITFTYQPVHWSKHFTNAGQVYYKLDDSPVPRFFFQKGPTYILVMPFPTDVFPAGLINHLIPIGNPISKEKDSGGTFIN